MSYLSLFQLGCFFSFSFHCSCNSLWVYVECSLCHKYSIVLVWACDISKKLNKERRFFLANLLQKLLINGLVRS